MINPWKKNLPMQCRPTFKDFKSETTSLNTWKFGVNHICVTHFIHPYSRHHPLAFTRASYQYVLTTHSLTFAGGNCIPNIDFLLSKCGVSGGRLPPALNGWLAPCWKRVPPVPLPLFDCNASPPLLPPARLICVLPPCTLQGQGFYGKILPGVGIPHSKQGRSFSVMCPVRRGQMVKMTCLTSGWHWSLSRRGGSF